MPVARRARAEGGNGAEDYRAQVLLLAADPRFVGHDTGPGHPERPARLEAIAAGVDASGLGTDVVTLELRTATRDELERVHPAAHLDRLEQGCADRAHFDADTPSSPGSWSAALAAAGAGLAAIAALTMSDDSAPKPGGAFLAVRPPGHHARASQAMGFCLLNNVAVAATELRARGDRVAIVDIDAHHGNGTQEIFYADPDVLYVSCHEWPLYPGTGRHDHTGAAAGVGATCNIPLPAGATGDVYGRAMDAVVEPLLANFAPDWMLISLGFDAHRDDPLTGLSLSAGDYASLAQRLMATVPKGRTVTFLEGGYSLSALRDSVALTLPVLAGHGRSMNAEEAPTAGGPGDRVVDLVHELWSERLR